MFTTHKIQGAGGTGGDSYWIALAGTSQTEFGEDVAIDSAGNIIAAGMTRNGTTSYYEAIVVKYDPSGGILWCKNLGSTSEETRFYGVAVDSSDNIIAVGFTKADGAGLYDALIAKYNSSGTLQWDRTLGGSDYDSFESVAIDSSDNIIAVGYTSSDGAGSNDFLIAKYNSSGTLQWDKTLGGSSGDTAYGVAIDSSDNIIVVGPTQSDGAGVADFLIAKYNSSGTLQWDKTLGGSSSDVSYGVAIDSFDNIIVVGYTKSGGAGDEDCLIAKYNSSGTLQWDKTLGGTSTNDRFNGVSIDSADNIIAVGFTVSDGAGSTDALIAKYNSSGVLQWDKTLGWTGGDVWHSVAIDPSDNIIACGYTTSDGAGGLDFLVAKLPSDGSGDGTYGSFIYEDAVLTDAAAVLTDAAAVLTSANAVLTDAAAVLTDQSFTLTEELFPV